MLPVMDRVPFRWSAFAKEFFPPLIGAALIAVPVLYFFGEDIVAFLRPYFS